jgi:hypothetical protein
MSRAVAVTRLIGGVFIVPVARSIAEAANGAMRRRARATGAGNLSRQSAPRREPDQSGERSTLGVILHDAA